MTLYAIAKYNKYFSRGAALSPSLWAFGTELAAFIDKGRFGKDTLLYMDYGSKEFDRRGIAKSNFCTAVDKLIKKDVNVTARIVAGGTHSEASWEKQIPHFLRSINLEC